MKRIDFIANGKGTVRDSEFRQKKVKKTIEDSIDNLEEEKYNAERKCERIINSIKDVADDKFMIAKKLNEYIQARADVEGYDKAKSYLKDVKKMLDDEIEVDENDLESAIKNLNDKLKF